MAATTASADDRNRRSLQPLRRVLPYVWRYPMTVAGAIGLAGGLLGQILSILCGLNLGGILDLLGGLGDLANLLNFLLFLFSL